MPSDWDDEEIGGAVALFIASLVAGGIVWYNMPAGWWAILLAPVLYPLIGCAITLLACQPLITWAFDEDLPRVGRLWMAALWPLALPVCAIVCPASGIIRRIF